MRQPTKDVDPSVAARRKISADLSGLERETSAETRASEMTCQRRARVLSSLVVATSSPAISATSAAIQQRPDIHRWQTHPASALFVSSHFRSRRDNSKRTFVRRTIFRSIARDRRGIRTIQRANPKRPPSRFSRASRRRGAPSSSNPRVVRVR